MANQKSNYRVVHGWNRDKPDARDFMAPHVHFTTAAPEWDLSTQVNEPPIYDQTTLGSCTGNGNAAVFDFQRKKQGLQHMNPSRLFIYYNERVIEGTVNTDSGAEIRDGIKTLAAQGVCPESLWPYNVNAFAIKPPAADYTTALETKALKYARVVQTATQFEHTIGVSGNPIVFGVTLYDSFESDEVATTGIIPMPSPYEQVAGGHCMVMVGYNRAKQLVKVRNSWGIRWGLKGYCWMPYAYLLNASLASDFWEITLESK